MSVKNVSINLQKQGLREPRWEVKPIIQWTLTTTVSISGRLSNKTMIYLDKTLLSK